MIISDVEVQVQVHDASAGVGCHPAGPGASDSDAVTPPAVVGSSSEIRTGVTMSSPAGSCGQCAVAMVTILASKLEKLKLQLEQPSR
jgi:hypothetical protein